MNEKIRIGFIGAGNICQNAHIPAYLAVGGNEFVGVCDIKGDRALEVKNKYGFKMATDSVDELVSRDDIDAISVCTWNDGHADAAIKALSAGKHVLCEKPMAMSVAQAQAMQAASEKSGKTLMMGFTLRHTDAARIICDIRESGALGDIYYGKTRTMRRRGTPLGWFTNKAKSGGGPIIDIGVHIIYLTWYLMGKPAPVAVSAKTHAPIGDYKTKAVGRWNAFDIDEQIFTVEDSGEGLVRFDNGAIMTFEASWAINGKGENDQSDIYGTKGGASYNPLTVYQEQCGYLLDATPYITIETNAFHNEIGHFLHCVRTGETPITSGKDGIEIQKILNGIYASSDADCEVRL